MQKQSIDRVARVLASPGSRRRALIAAGLVMCGFASESAHARRDPTGSSLLNKKRNRAERQDQRKKKNSGKKKGVFPKDCQRFVISAGPSTSDRFQHIDDDLLIELIPRGRKGTIKVLLKDDNDSPNGEGGSHPSVPPFTARVGDQLHIVARNEVAGGCELDEIWLHCIEGRGGKVKLTDAITPEQCRADAGRVGVFFDETLRISNK
jgi:hypothetical protein